MQYKETKMYFFKYAKNICNLRKSHRLLVLHLFEI